MSLQLRTEYWNDTEARTAFKAFMFQIHGLDFNQWETRGYWDSAYTPFSFFNDGEVIASVCIYLLDAVIGGNRTKLAQVSGVGTHPDWRRKGLNRELTNLGLDWARGRNDGVFLFADDQAIPYYKHCGFSPINESLHSCKVKPVATRPGIYHLDPADQASLDRIYFYACNRAPISDFFSLHSPKLLMFHALYTLRNNIFEIPDLECLVFFDREGDLIHLYDILGKRIPSLEELYPYLSAATDSRIHFHFHTEKLGIEGIRIDVNTGNNTFVKGSFPVSEPAFPFTSRA
jgi:GNAT superfamily N-acetyltransferase